MDSTLHKSHSPMQHNPMGMPFRRHAILGSIHPLGRLTGGLTTGEKAHTTKSLAYHVPALEGLVFLNT